MHTQAVIGREDRALGRFKEGVRSEVLAAASAVRDAQIDRSAALESSILPRPELPESLGVNRRDFIIGTPERCVRAYPEVHAAYQHGRFTVHGPKGKGYQTNSATPP